MTGSEIRALVADGLVAIGAHTVTHPVLVGLGAAACHREISESKLACEALFGARSPPLPTSMASLTARREA